MSPKFTLAERPPMFTLSLTTTPVSLQSLEKFPLEVAEVEEALALYNCLSDSSFVIHTEESEESASYSQESSSLQSTS